MDSNGVDIFIGSKMIKRVEGVFCTIDMVKNDTEIKIMYGFYKDEIDMALRVVNSKFMGAILVKRIEMKPSKVS